MSAENHNHGGHRDRMKSALLKNGAEKLDDVHILEMLLFYVVPRTDTRKTAEDLIENFGSLQGVMEAEKGEILKFKGLKDNAEVLFMLLRELFERCGGTRNKPSLLEPERMKKHLVNLYKGVSAETVYALYFTQNGSFVGEEIIFRGDMSSARFSLRLITEGVIRAGGCGVVLAHNHPSNSLVPSGDDILSTKRMAAHLAANDIELIEHYIVGKTDAVPFYKRDFY